MFRFSTYKGTFGSQKVYVVKPLPKFVLSPKVPLSDAFREETQEWLNSFFGFTQLVQDNEVIKFDDSNGNTALFVNQQTYEAFEILTQKGQK